MRATRVLVLEDDPDIQEYLSALLEDHAHGVLRASRVEEAIEHLEGGGVDLVILDVMLQERSGLDLLVALRKNQRWCDLAVIMLTGNEGVLRDGGRSYLAHLGLAGRAADAVLGKPLDPALLLEAVAQALSPG